MGKMNLQWQEKAACKGFDINEFYPTKGKPISSKVIKACESCPVKTACLEHALRFEEYGYWAGTNRNKRKAMRKALNISLESINIDNIISETIDKVSIADKIWSDGSDIGIVIDE
jgi:Transcription factor WhiB